MNACSDGFFAVPQAKIWSLQSCHIYKQQLKVIMARKSRSDRGKIVSPENKSSEFGDGGSEGGLHILGGFLA